jgi:hypothetical protein
VSSIPRNPRPSSDGSDAASTFTSPRLVAMALIGVGALLVLGALFADPLGISGGGEGFGWKQLIATIVGLVLAILGTGLRLGAFGRGGSTTRREPLVPLDES